MSSTHRWRTLTKLKFYVSQSSQKTCHLKTLSASLLNQLFPKMCFLKLLAVNVSLQLLNCTNFAPLYQFCTVYQTAR